MTSGFFSGSIYSEHTWAISFLFFSVVADVVFWIIVISWSGDLCTEGAHVFAFGAISSFGCGVGIIESSSGLGSEAF